MKMPVLFFVFCLKKTTFNYIETILGCSVQLCKGARVDDGGWKLPWWCHIRGTWLLK